MHQFLLNEPTVINIEPEVDSVEQIAQFGYWISEEKKGPLLRHLIQEKNLTQVLVFTSSTRRADNVAFKLYKNGIDAEAIHSKMSQGARTEVLRKFKSGKLRVLVATDLLGRGIDIEDMPCVINYELPRSPKDYIHRIGRTGRAEASGEAISFVTPDDEHHFKIIQKKTGQRMKMVDGDDLLK
jgi:ATP-dependent RNA helicase RhlE